MDAKEIAGVTFLSLMKLTAIGFGVGRGDGLLVLFAMVAIG